MSKPSPCVYFPPSPLLVLARGATIGRRVAPGGRGRQRRGVGALAFDRPGGSHRPGLRRGPAREPAFVAGKCCASPPVGHKAGVRPAEKGTGGATGSNGVSQKMLASLWCRVRGSGGEGRPSPALTVVQCRGVSVWSSHASVERREGAVIVEALATTLSGRQIS